MNARRLLLLLLAVTVLASGCAKRTFDNERVIELIDATTPHAYRLVYEVEEGDVDVSVRGIVQDDFRYKLQLTLGDKPAAEQVVVDDGVALRFFDPSLIRAFTDPAVEGDVDLKTDIEGADVFAVLAAGRWVLDEAGAPSAILTALDEDDDVDTPRDPLFDARTALEYVRRIADTTNFVEYDPESLNPTYRRDEDPFPAPEDDSGVRRYDAVIRNLPSPAQATQGRDLPSAQNFRKMAVYVKDGVVFAVREFIGANPRQLRDLQDYEEALLEATAGEEVLAAFKQRLASLRGDEDATIDFLLGGLNTFITSTGEDPIRFRTMALEISDLDAVTTAVRLPSDVVRGDLAVMRNLGRKPLVDDAASSASS